MDAKKIITTLMRDNKLKPLTFTKTVMLVSVSLRNASVW